MSLVTEGKAADFMLKTLFKGALALGVFVLIVIVFNQSFWVERRSTDVKILSHRGVHQTFNMEGVNNQTCTAFRIFEPTHGYLENTVRGVKAAFDYGADAVEIDTIRTRDNDFVVFHDWTLECRTNGYGRVIDHDLAELQALDIGHGYSYDGGKTYPFRGKAVGQMLSLRDFLSQFSGREFIINAKGNSAKNAELLAGYIKRYGLQSANKLSLFSGPNFAQRWRALNMGLGVSTKADALACVKGYLALGWLGHVPDICRTTGLAVPQNLSGLYWGWPNLTLERMSNQGVDIVLVGKAGPYLEAIDRLEQLQAIPKGYDGWIVTNRVDIIGPGLKAR